MCLQKRLYPLHIKIADKIQNGRYLKNVEFEARKD